jgi:hypothetical protein
MVILRKMMMIEFQEGKIEKEGIIITEVIEEE